MCQRVGRQVNVVHSEDIRIPVRDSREKQKKVEEKRKEKSVVPPRKECGRQIQNELKKQSHSIKIE